MLAALSKPESLMRRIRYIQALFAVAALAAPLLAAADPRYAVTAVVGSMSALTGGANMQAWAADMFNGVPNFPEDPFIYHKGVMTGLGNLDGPWSAALSVNDLEQVVGYLGVDSLPGKPGELYPTTAFLYENGEMIDLNTLGDPASGWTITDAAAINDVQQIAARACRAGICQAISLDLVSAVPEPPVFALLAAGLALGLARGKAGFRLPVRRRRG
jgi:probable HAF family extracellular repeat protein